jgi:hypothetical protein
MKSTYLTKWLCTMPLFKIGIIYSSGCIIHECLVIEVFVHFFLKPAGEMSVTLLRPCLDPLATTPFQIISFRFSTYIGFF